MTDLVLGTANIGLAYGQALSRALPDEEQALGLLAAADCEGFTALDTAAAYGVAEHRIGRYLDIHNHSQLAIHTKLAPGLCRADQLHDALNEMRQTLGKAPAQILLHRWTQRQADNGSLWDELRAARDAGLCGKLGASVQSPDETQEALSDPDVEVIQLAYNLLDWRYETAQMQTLLQSADARVEVRSIFLQGLLTLDPQMRWPDLGHPYDSEGLADYVSAQAAHWTNGDSVSLCLRFVSSLDWVDALIIGADGPDQLRQLSHCMTEGPLPNGAIDAIRAARPSVPEALLDPSQWL